MDNKMTFFSGTDTATLKEEGMDRNHFVSLIVNNEGTYTAAITRKLKATKIIKEEFSYPTFEDNEVVDSKSYQEEVEQIEWFYLKIEFEKEKESFCDELDTRLEEIKKAKAARAAQKQPVYNGGYGSPQGGKPYQGTLFPTVPTQEVKPGNYQPGKKVTQSYVGQTGPANVAKESDLPFDYDYIDNKISDEIPYGKVTFNKNIIKSLVLQLVTGSVIIPNSSKIDINKWAKGMVPLYENRFGKGEYGLKLFKTWADNYIEFLCWFSDDDNLIEQGYQDDEMAAICAHDIIEELTKLPENTYIKIYIDILEGYLR